jgi:hypothetical protein
MAPEESNHWLAERQAVESLAEAATNLRRAAETAPANDAAALLSAAAGADEVLASLRLQLGDELFEGP